MSIPPSDEAERGETTASDKEFFSSRGFGNRVGFGNRPAVIVVDFMKGFTDPNARLGAPLERELAEALKILRSARSHRIPVLHTTVEYDGADLPGIWKRKQAGLSDLIKGTEAVELDDRLERRTDEPIIVKKYASAFFGTDLVPRLNALTIDTVIVLGCTTSGCVRATAVDAVQFGYRPIVAREAVGDRSEQAHRQALFDLDQKYADVESASAVMSYLARVGVES